MSKEAMKLAQKAIEAHNSGDWDAASELFDEALPALRKALANEALDRVSENARELGLDYGVEQDLRVFARVDAMRAKGLLKLTATLEQPAQRKPLTDEWVPVTQSLLNEQHPWLYQPMWIAMKGGVVVQGYYAWRQGRNPDRFITDLGDEWAFNADCVMPMVKPTPPTIEAAHGIKGDA